MDQLMSNCSPLFLMFHMCFERLVLCWYFSCLNERVWCVVLSWYFSCLNERVWFLYRSLKLFAYIYIWNIHMYVHGLITRYGNWNDVSRYVDTKGATECRDAVNQNFVIGNFFSYKMGGFLLIWSTHWRLKGLPLKTLKPNLRLC